MKQLPKRVLAAACAAAMLGAGTSALAAETPAPGISVQLDGQNLTFTDVAPEAQNGRTFLPFRTVFEAMGALVTYDAATQAVTATRDGTTVTMTLGSTTATVETGGVTTQVTMDVAPYAHDNRTFVPVRFAAQAFGCTVGWDQDDQTVILIDTQKLLADTLSRYDFTYLEQCLAYGQKYNEGTWDVDAAFDGSLSMLGAGPMTVEGTLDGTMAGGTKLQYAMTLLMDLNALLAGDETGMSTEDQALLDSLAEDGVQMELRGDLEEGTMYFNLGGAFLEQAAGTDADTWYLMDLASLFAGTGVDYASLLSSNLDYTNLIAALLAASEPTDQATAYADMAAGVDLVAQMLRDDAWTTSGNDRILHYSLDQNGVAVDLTFTLTLRGDEVTAYDLDMEMTMTDETGAATTLSFQAAMDAQDEMKATVRMAQDQVMDLTLNMTGSYDQGSTAPVTEPPAGATVVDLFGSAA